jgi:hypothetical protein
MRTFMIENTTKAIELLLLRCHRACWRLGCFLFQCAMHSFVSPILLRVSWLYALVNNPELHPSQRQLRQTQEADARERRSVVRADTFWHTELTHRGIANGAYLS